MQSLTNGQWRHQATRLLTSVRTRWIERDVTLGNVTLMILDQLNTKNIYLIAP